MCQPSGAEMPERYPNRLSRDGLGNMGSCSQVASAVVIGTVLVIGIANSAAPGLAQKPSHTVSFASGSSGAKKESSRSKQKKKNKKKERSNSCPPDWMRETNGSGVQIGTGQPDGVPPIGCSD